MEFQGYTLLTKVCRIFSQPITINVSEEYFRSRWSLRGIHFCQKSMGYFHNLLLSMYPKNILEVDGVSEVYTFDKSPWSFRGIHFCQKSMGYFHNLLLSMYPKNILEVDGV